MKILGLIPARAGSKGIKNKNIIDLGGMPLVEHTFKFVSNLKSIHKLALSTDSKKIIEICSKYKKIEVPFVVVPSANILIGEYLPVSSINSCLSTIVLTI